ncbi:hypothetical protein [Mucilaginibacter sp. AK015]|uniref:hypothetical protein n=1 Tax=Mucilaginibacter sp. AK015 TaxID=2723072 RepID=UPI0016197361|nr:hypothetical protein [Mucilaginibacter sp. AK015]
MFVFFKVLKRASPFCLETKEAKIQVRKKVSLPHKAFNPQTGQNHGLQNLATTSFAHPYASGKYCYALAPLKATIVLPAFARSCFADTSSQLLTDTCLRA